MTLIDTHTHLFTEEFDLDLGEVIERAEAAGLAFFCLPNIDSDSVGRLHTVCDRYPGRCFPMMGLHPTSVKADFRRELDHIRSLFGQRNYIAVGEIGIDLYWDKTYLKEQKEAFEEQLQWSIDFGLPVSIHTREAFPEVFDSLHRVGADKLKGVFHSFGGSREELEEILRCPGFMIGINGVVTYKKSLFRDYLPLAPIERIVLETDAPYLTPVPFRGKRNEPAYILKTAEKLSEVYNLPLRSIAEKTSANAKSLFNLI